MGHADKFAIDDGKQKAQHALVELKCLLHMVDQRCFGGELVEHVVALAAVCEAGRGIGQTPEAPVVDLGDFAAIFLNRSSILFNYLLVLTITSLGIQDTYEFVVLHWVALSWL